MPGSSGWTPFWLFLLSFYFVFLIFSFRIYIWISFSRYREMYSDPIWSKMKPYNLVAYTFTCLVIVGFVYAVDEPANSLSKFLWYIILDSPYGSCSSSTNLNLLCATEFSPASHLYVIFIFPAKYHFWQFVTGSHPLFYSIQVHLDDYFLQGYSRISFFGSQVFCMLNASSLIAGFLDFCSGITKLIKIGLSCRRKYNFSTREYVIVLSTFSCRKFYFLGYS